MYTPLALLYKLLFPAVRLYWSIFSPEIRGVRCLIENQGKLLLIRQTYGDMKWTLPGGMINKNESPDAAAVRELKEEVGISLARLDSLGTFIAEDGRLRDTVYCYSASVRDPILKIDRNEIYEAAWFTRWGLPESQSTHTIKALQLYAGSSMAMDVRTTDK